jgi:DNA recombination protein RmuC
LQGINKTVADRIEALTDRMADINKTNREEQARNLREFAAEQSKKTEELVKNTETKLESIRVTVEEKLEKTLSERLGQSFETVGRQLIEVQKGWARCRPLPPTWEV